MQYPCLNRDADAHAASKCLFRWQEEAVAEERLLDPGAFVERGHLLVVELRDGQRIPSAQAQDCAVRLGIC